MVVGTITAIIREVVLLIRMGLFEMEMNFIVFDFEEKKNERYLNCEAKFKISKNIANRQICGRPLAAELQWGN